MIKAFHFPLDISEETVYTDKLERRRAGAVQPAGRQGRTQCAGLLPNGPNRLALGLGIVRIEKHGLGTRRWVTSLFPAMLTNGCKLRKRQRPNRPANCGCSG